MRILTHTPSFLISKNNLISNTFIMKRRLTRKKYFSVITRSISMRKQFFSDFNFFLAKMTNSLFFCSAIINTFYSFIFINFSSINPTIWTFNFIKNRVNQLYLIFTSTIIMNYLFFIKRNNIFSFFKPFITSMTSKKRSFGNKGTSFSTFFDKFSKFFFTFWMIKKSYSIFKQKKFFPTILAINKTFCFDNLFHNILFLNPYAHN